MRGVEHRPLELLELADELGIDPGRAAFFGFGGGVGVSVGFGFGSVGWLPIGPCDRFYPWYGRYGSHYNVVNVTNIYNIHNGPGRGFGGIAPLRVGGAYSNLRLA